MAFGEGCFADFRRYGIGLEYSTGIGIENSILSTLNRSIYFGYNIARD
jgi:hypothetical protein